MMDSIKIPDIPIFDKKFVDDMIKRFIETSNSALELMNCSYEDIQKNALRIYEESNKDIKQLKKIKKLHLYDLR